MKTQRFNAVSLGFFKSEGRSKAKSTGIENSVFPKCKLPFVFGNCVNSGFYSARIFGGYFPGLAQTGFAA